MLWKDRKRVTWMKLKHQSILPIFYALLLQKEKLMLWKGRKRVTWMKPNHQSILPIFYALLLQKEKLVLWKERMMMTLHMFGNKERKRKEKKLVIFSLFGLQKGAAGLHYTFLSIYTDIGWLREGRPRWITFANFFFLPTKQWKPNQSLHFFSIPFPFTRSKCAWHPPKQS